MATGEYPGSTLYPASSSNYSVASRLASNSINKIMVHVTRGSWAGAIDWFGDPNAQISAHYTVRSSDDAIGHSVREKGIAWHAGNWPYNQTRIGFEQEGFVSDSRWFTEAMYGSSAQLVACLCNKYDILRDRTHTIGHNDVPDSNKSSTEAWGTTPPRAVTRAGPNTWTTSSTTRARPPLLPPETQT
jgi:N-acetyl-anhydromuramyl-L-alanine amidase AmpD